MRRRLLIALLAAIAVTLLGATLAGAAKQKPKNGGFETGDFSRWTVNSSDSDEGDTWYVYSGTTLPQQTLAQPLRGGGPTTFFTPPQGTFAAVTDGGAGTRILYRTLKLAKNKKHKLKMWLQYANHADEFFSPDTLDSSSTEEPNQQYRVDLLRKNAPIDSLDDDDVVKEVFGTEPGDPLSMSPTKFRVNLTKYAGRKLRLRFAEADNQFYFNAGVDGVKLKSKPKK